MKTTQWFWLLALLTATWFLVIGVTTVFMLFALGSADLVDPKSFCVPAAQQERTLNAAVCWLVLLVLLLGSWEGWLIRCEAENKGLCRHIASMYGVLTAFIVTVVALWWWIPLACHSIMTGTYIFDPSFAVLELVAPLVMLVAGFVVPSSIILSLIRLRAIVPPRRGVDTTRFAEDHSYGSIGQ